MMGKINCSSNKLFSIYCQYPFIKFFTILLLTRTVMAFSNFTTKNVFLTITKGICNEQPAKLLQTKC